MKGIIHQLRTSVPQHNGDWLQSFLLGLCTRRERQFWSCKCFYMIKIKIHNMVHDILWFPGKCALTSAAKTLQMPRSHRGSNLLTCLSLSSKTHLHETLSFPSGPLPSHIKTKNRGKYFIYAVSANVSRHDAWQIIEKWFLMSLSQACPLLFIFSVNH